MFRSIGFEDGQRGSGLVSALAAAAIVATVAVGTGSLAQYLVRQSQRAQLLNRALALQNAVQSALLDKTQYRTGVSPERDAQIQKMLHRQPVDDLALHVAGQPTPVARVGRRTHYDVDGKVCAELSESCPLFVDVGIVCPDLEDGCRAAFRVGMWPAPGAAAIPTLGAPVLSSGVGNGSPSAQFLGPDYTLGLSYDFFEQRPHSSCAGDPNNVLVTGMNRITGEVSCVARAAAPCAPGQVAEGVNAVDGRLELRCRGLSAAQCPTNYVMQQIHLGELDRGSGTPAGVRGTCVYRWRNDVPWQDPIQQPPQMAAPPTNMIKVSKRVCNSLVYDAVGDTPDCQANVSNRSRTCGGTTVTADVSAVGSIDPATNVVWCTLTITQKSCGGESTNATGYPYWNGRCLVKERTRNPSLKTAPVGGVLTQ